MTQDQVLYVASGTGLYSPATTVAASDKIQPHPTELSLAGMKRKATGMSPGHHQDVQKFARQTTPLYPTPPSKPQSTSSPIKFSETVTVPPPSDDGAESKSSDNWSTSVGKRPPRDMKRLDRNAWYQVTRTAKWGDTPAIFLQALEPEKDETSTTSTKSNVSPGFFKPPQKYFGFAFELGDRVKVSAIGYSQSRNKVATDIEIDTTHRVKQVTLPAESHHVQDTSSSLPTRTPSRLTDASLHRMRSGSFDPHAPGDVNISVLAQSILAQQQANLASQTQNQLLSLLVQTLSNQRAQVPVAGSHLQSLPAAAQQHMLDQLNTHPLARQQVPALFGHPYASNVHAPQSGLPLHAAAAMHAPRSLPGQSSGLNPAYSQLLGRNYLAAPPSHPEIVPPRHHVPQPSAPDSQQVDMIALQHYLNMLSQQNGARNL